MAIRGLTAVLTIMAGVSALTAAVVFAQDDAASAAQSAPSAPSAPSTADSSLLTTKSEDKAEKKDVLLTIGEDKVYDIDFEANDVEGKGIVEGNPQIVKAQLVRIQGKPRQIILKPLKEGTTTVTVRDKDAAVQLIMNVTVTSQDLMQMMVELKDLLRDIEGIEIRIISKNIVIDGEVYTPQDYGRLFNVLDAANSPYAGVVVNLTTFSPLALESLARRIETDIQSFAKDVKVRVVNGRIWLTGSVDNRSQAQRAIQVANLYVPDVRPLSPLENAAAKDMAARNTKAANLIQNFILVNPPPEKKEDKQIRVTVHFVELSKDYQRAFGFKWQPGFATGDSDQISFGTQADGATGSTALNFSATISNLFPRLSAAQKAGFARILKTGTLIVKNGQAATMKDTRSFTFAVSSGNPQDGAAAAQSTTGLSVAVTPKILGKSEDIELDLDMNQINLVGFSANGAPQEANHAIKTKIFVKSNESAAVTAVQSEDVASGFNKDDPSGTAPAGGALFTLLRSKQYAKNKSQYVIFVTPQIIENASDGTGDLKKNFRVKVN